MIQLYLNKIKWFAIDSLWNVNQVTIFGYVQLMNKLHFSIILLFLYCFTLFDQLFNQQCFTLHPVHYTTLHTSLCNKYTVSLHTSHLTLYLTHSVTALHHWPIRMSWLLWEMKHGAVFLPAVPICYHTYGLILYTRHALHTAILNWKWTSNYNATAVHYLAHCT